MEKLILIKYGELSTKKDNINFFIKTLKENIEKVLDGIDHKIKYDFGRMFIYSSDLDLVEAKLKYVFGVHEYNNCLEINTNDLDEIKKSLKTLLDGKKITTFKVITKRQDKTYPIKSMDISRDIGEFVLKNFNGTKVDVINPKTKIYLEIRKDGAYIYFEKREGIGGYPVGVQGKGLLMLSGGIDSPVAGYLAMKRGVKIEAIYFDSPPYTSRQALEKVKSLSKVLSNYSGSICLHVIPFTKMQNEIRKNVPHEYLVTIMRRMMYRITERLSKKVHAKIIINGESIGQVASQTLTSMGVIESTVSTPVIRPVACLDKLEIIKISKDIETYDISILPYEDCCTIFVPEHPVINPSPQKAIEFESTFDYESLIKECIKNEEVIKITNKEENEFSDLI